MNWFNIALGFLFFCNLVFMLGAAYLLMRILDASEQGQMHLQKAAAHVVEAGTHVKVAVKRAFHEMERHNDALNSRESSAARSVDGLSFQIKTLVERVKQVVEQRLHEQDAATPPDAQQPDSDAIRARLQEELQAALAKNHALQDEIDQTHYKLKDALHANRELRDALGDAKGIRQELVDSLMARSNELQLQLEQALARAQNAEELAAKGATQMEEIRNQIDQQTFVTVQQGVDQSELVADQQLQIDSLAAREKELRDKLAQLEGAFSRNQAEKHFIEERFLQLDAGSAPASAAPPPAS